MESFDIPTSVTIDYTDIMAELSVNFVKVYAIFAVIVLIYTLMNMFVFGGKDFKYKEDVRQAFNACVLMLSLFVCAVSVQYYFRL